MKQVVTPSTKRSPAMSPSSTSSPQAERRAWVRYPCDLDTSCRPYVGGDDLRWSARVQDISRGGLRLEVERRFEIGTILSISLESEKDDVPPTLLARVVHIGRQANGNWMLGCRFARELSERELQAILGTA